MKRDSSNNGAEAELLLGRVLTEYTRRKRAGEAPDVDEYVARHPQLPDLRELLVTVDSLEQLDPRAPAHAAGIPIQRLGQYRIEHELGRGGMGVVFLAHDERLDRRVALKLLPLQATLDARFLARFEREARAAAKLNHPGIVPVFGVGEHERLHYYAMQYVEGHSLDRVLRKLRSWSGSDTSRGDTDSVAPKARDLLVEDMSRSTSPRDPPLPMPPARPLPPIEDLPIAPKRPRVYYRNVAQLVLQVAEALAYAHSRGVLHRDIKPGNLLLSAGGRVWVTDFGLCKTMEAEPLTVTTDFVGTLRYMAPEQIDGRADVRSDVYQLGATLYELLTLRAMFQGKDRGALVRAVTDEPPLRPRRVRPDVPPDLEAICLKAIAKLPEERYGTAAALGEDLRAFLDGRPVLARPPGALHLLRLLVRRNRALALAVLAFVTVLALATGLYTRSLQRARQAQDRQLYLATLAAARLGAPTLDRAPAELRNWEWDHYASRVDNSLRTIERADARLRVLAVDPAGAWVYFGEDPALLRAVELAEPGRSWSVATGASGVERLAVSGDGRRIVTAGAHDLQVWTVAPDGATPVARCSVAAKVTALAIDPLSGHVFVGDANGLVHALHGERLEELYALHGHTASVSGVCLAAAGRRLVSCSEDGTLRSWDLETRTATVLEGQVGRHVALDVSHDGAWIAAAGANHTIQLWNAREQRSEAILAGHSSSISRVAFSPDGRSLASASTDQSIRIWDVDTARPYDNARPYRPLWGHEGPLVGAEFLPDGRLVSASLDGQLKEWDPTVTGGVALLEGHIGDVWSMAFDRRGERLLTTGRDGTVRVWDVRAGRVARVLFGAPSGLWSAVFSPGGERVATGHRDGWVRVWDVDRAVIVTELAPPLGPGEQRREIARVAFAPDGTRLWAVELSHGLCEWEREGETYRFVRRIPVDGALALDVAPDGRSLAVGTHDGHVVVLDTATWKCRFDVLAHADQIQHVRFEPAGRRLFSAGFDGLLSIRRASDGAPIRTIRVVDEQAQITRHLVGLAIWPDGSRVACATEAQGVTVWDTEHGDLVATLRGPGRGYLFVDVSPDGRRLACGSWDGVIRLWDSLTVRERRTELAALRADDALADARLADARRASGGALDETLALLTALPRDDPAREPALERLYAEAGSFEGLLTRLRGLLRAPGLDRRRALEARALAHGLYHRMRADRRVQLAEGEALLRTGDVDAAILAFEPIVRTSRAEEPDVEAELLLALAYARAGRAAEARSLIADARGAGVARHVGVELLLAEAEAALDAR